MPAAPETRPDGAKPATPAPLIELGPALGPPLEAPAVCCEAPFCVAAPPQAPNSTVTKQVATVRAPARKRDISRCVATRKSIFKLPPPEFE